MRALTLALPLSLLACSGDASDDKASPSTTETGTPTVGDDDDDDTTVVDGDDDDDTTVGDDDDDTTIGDDDDDDTTTSGTHVCHTDPLALQVGTGIVMFEPLTQGAEVIIVHGPQGGWHIDIGGEVGGTTDLIEISSVITRNSTGVVIAGDQQPSRIALPGWSSETCLGAFYGITTYVDDDPATDQAYICGMEGETLTIELTVTDLSFPAKSVTETLEVTMALDPIDEKPCAAL